MDPSFSRRARRLLTERSPAPLDYDVLVATLGAIQTSGSAQEAGEARPDQAALVDLLAGAAGWRDARTLQGGCFNRALRARRKGDA